MSAYYNEHDPFAAAWLRELIKANLIAPGEVDERDIQQVRADDLRGFVQCHFFAGIGVWSYSLRLAGWSDDVPVWTGSCPCQSFSASGQRTGFDDPRHLWPAWFGLIRELRPNVIFGEQVASKDGLAWLDVVSADMETEAYSIGTTDLCTAGFGGPHIRQRLYWLANSESAALGRPAQSRNGTRRNQAQQARTGAQARRRGSLSGMEHSYRAIENRLAPEREQSLCNARSEDGRLGDSDIARLEGNGGGNEGSTHQIDTRATGATRGFWAGCEWIYCADGRFRPVEPGTFPLASGIAKRMEQVRGYGNSIVAPVAQAFIEAAIECGIGVNRIHSALERGL